MASPSRQHHPVMMKALSECSASPRRVGQNHGPSVCRGVPDVIGALAVWIQQQKKGKNGTKLRKEDPRGRPSLKGPACREL